MRPRRSNKTPQLARVLGFLRSDKGIRKYVRLHLPAARYLISYCCVSHCSGRVCNCRSRLQAEVRKRCNFSHQPQKLTQQMYTGTIQVSLMGWTKLWADVWITVPRFPRFTKIPRYCVSKRCTISIWDLKESKMTILFQEHQCRLRDHQCRPQDHQYGCRGGKRLKRGDSEIWQKKPLISR